MALILMGCGGKSETVKIETPVDKSPEVAEKTTATKQTEEETEVDLDATFEEMLNEEGLHPQGLVIDSVNCSSIENYINSLTLIKECQVYKTNSKMVVVDIVCREPVLKVIDKCGSTYYVDIEGEKIADIKKPLRLPVASGEIDDTMIGKELLSVVAAIEKDPFWLAQIQQIYFNDKKEAIITPRLGDHIIELGSVRHIDEKLANLKTFYINGLGTVGWNKYSKLNIKISNKVICTKR